MMGWFKDFFSSEEEVKKEKEKYFIEVKCKNCKFREQVEIKRKITVKEGIKNLSCSNCGLKKLRILNWNDYFEEFGVINSYTEEENET